MSNEIVVLAGVAAIIGFVHTIFGPDHYLPFIVLSSLKDTLLREYKFIADLRHLAILGRCMNCSK